MPAQFQVRPVIERVAKRVRHRARPRNEFLLCVGAAGDEFLRLAVGAHRPPLVMVAFEPHLAEVCELPVARNLRRRQVIMIIMAI